MGCRANLTHSQARCLRSVVQNRTVHDIGCGSGELSRWMAQNGAWRVYAVDKDIGTLPKKFAQPNVVRVAASFAAYSKKLAGDVGDVAVISWPWDSKHDGLVELLRKFTVVVYIGKNTDGSACGSNDLWQHLTTRALREEIPDQRNVLLHYGPEVFDKPALRSEEEIAGLLNTGMFNIVEYGTLVKVAAVPVDEHEGVNYAFLAP